VWLREASTVGEGAKRKVFKPQPRLEKLTPARGEKGEKGMSEKQAQKGKAVETQVEEKYRITKTFKEIADKILAKKKEAKDNNTWASIILYEFNGYSLEITVSPDGRAFLRIVSPNLRNSFIIANADALHFLTEVGKFIDVNWQLLNNVLGVLGTKSSTRRNAEYL
jgi:hypothetical protein